jgi:hypothetical protein
VVFLAELYANDEIFEVAVGKYGVWLTLLCFDVSTKPLCQTLLVLVNNIIDRYQKLSLTLTWNCSRAALMQPLECINFHSVVYIKGLQDVECEEPDVFAFG